VVRKSHELKSPSTKFGASGEMTCSARTASAISVRHELCRP
jgi:hypothetical protein